MQVAFDRKYYSYHEYPEVSGIVYDNNNTKKKIEANKNKLKKMLEERNDIRKSKIIKNAILELELKQKYIGINDLYPTTYEAFETMFEVYPECIRLEFNRPIKVLDPCAGYGSLLDHLTKVWKNIEVYAIEINEEFHELLEEKGYKVIGKDLFDVEKLEFDYIFMNPSFDKEFDVIKYVYENFLNQEGDLISITSATFLNRGTDYKICSKDKKVNDWIHNVVNESVMGFKTFDKSKFKKSCTNVMTGVLWLNKDE